MKKRRSHKGIYKPINPSKYAGDPTRIVWRSSWELRFCKYCDKTDDIIYWASEELAIPYTNPITRKRHRYFPDFIIKTKKGKRYMTKEVKNIYDGEFRVYQKRSQMASR